jgi:hypothetical protein
VHLNNRALFDRHMFERPKGAVLVSRGDCHKVIRLPRPQQAW